MQAHLIQRQIPIGSEVIFSQKNGNEVSGHLIEIGNDHVTVKNKDRITTILLEMIGSWQVIEAAENKSSAQTTPNDIQLDQQEVIKRLLEIKARFDAQIQVASITIHPPEFNIPGTEINGKNSAEVLKIWERAKSKYEYALKINELSPKFGRVQHVLSDLKTLNSLLPNSIYVKRHLAYANWLIGNNSEATKLYKETAIISDESIDWQNLAVTALTDRSDILALYSLEQYFNKTFLNHSPGIWYFLLKLIIQYKKEFILGNFGQKEFSSEDAPFFLDSIIYMVEISDRQDLSLNIMEMWMKGISPFQLITDSSNHFNCQPDPEYQKISLELGKKNKVLPIPKPAAAKSEGFINSYKADKNFGFITGSDGNEYFFHRSAITDEELIERIYDFNDEKISVIFEIAEGPKGPLAISITLIRTIEELYSLAFKHANNGDYPKAISQMKKVLEIDADFRDATQMHEKWRGYARLTGVPRGSNPYARAKRLHLIEKDLDRAAQLFNEAIRQGDNLESAVKDLAALLVQQGNPQGAIDILLKNRSKMFDRQSVDNMLISFYQNAGQYDSAISLLKNKLSRTSNQNKKAQLIGQIANGYFRKEDFSTAESYFRDLIRLQSDNNTAHKNLSICLFKQSKYNEAEKILNKTLSLFPDPQVADLLNEINRAKAEPHSLSGEKIIEITLSTYSGEISSFTQFFLDKCDYQGVPPDHVQAKKFTRGDIKNLESLATQLGTRRPRDRATYYLSAAKILSSLEDEDQNLFFKYLCRSFASRGDAVVIENRHLDSAREFYCESLYTYDSDQSKGQDEQDAVNALVRFLFSTLGQAEIPTTPKIPTIDETLEKVFQQHPDRNKLFDSLTYLIHRSRFAAKRILNRLYNKSSFQAMALDYLRLKCDLPIDGVKTLDAFIRLWNNLQIKIFQDNRSISYDLQFIQKIELTTIALEGCIERIKGITNQLFFELDQQRTLQLQKMLEITLDLCRQFSFEEQERLCVQIGSQCEDFLKEIEITPTKFSIEELYPVIESIRAKTDVKLNELYESSAPQLSLRLPVESYTPDAQQQIEIQITIENRIGCSPADACELIVQEYADIYSLIASEIKSESSLRGGDPRILRVPIRISKEALQSQTFSLPVYLQYRTRSAEVKQTPVNNFSIRLYSNKEFENINNRYAPYAEGGVVANLDMFYGRDEMIKTVAKTIQESKLQSKCVIIYGQKRSGKSSILYHLQNKLKADDKLLIVDLGNIGKFLDDDTALSHSFLYRILWNMINQLMTAIEDKVGKGKSPIELPFQNDSKAFFEHPSPMTVFTDIFDRFKRQTNKIGDWQNVRIVLLIDEFQYIYTQILAGKTPESFMKNWKAFLQENYFSAILVGQDVMPKFKQRFPNEFGTTQDERVTYLQRDDAVRLIDEPIRVGGSKGESRFRERAIERIIDLTACNPFYIQILCNQLVNYMNKKRARLVTEADVEQVKQDLLTGGNALGIDKFDNLLNSGDTSPDAISDGDALKVLTAIALNSQTGPCNRNNIICETTAPVDDILDDLVERDVVERKRGHYYSIRVGLFKEWLTAHP